MCDGLYVLQWNIESDPKHLGMYATETLGILTSDLQQAAVYIKEVAQSIVDITPIFDMVQVELALKEA